MAIILLLKGNKRKRQASYDRHGSCSFLMPELNKQIIRLVWQRRIYPKKGIYNLSSLYSCYLRIGRENSLEIILQKEPEREIIMIMK